VGQPAKLSSFPNIEELDLRRTSLSPFQIPQLRALGPKTRLLQLTYLERVGRPYEYFEALRELYDGLAELAHRCRVEAELHVDKSPHAGSFMLSDADLKTITNIPAPVVMTKLHVSHQLAYGVRDLAPLTTLSSLRSLDIVTYCADIDNESFRGLSVLTSMTSLHFGIVNHVSGDGLVDGLAGSAATLQELALVDCSSLQNAGLAALTASLPQLRRLSLIKIPWLTNSCVGGALMRLGVLTCLQLHDNGNISCGDGGLQQLAKLPLLRQVDIKRFPRFTPQDVNTLLQFDNLVQVNDRCKLRRTPDSENYLAGLEPHR